MISNCSVVFPSAESRALYVNELLHRAHEPCGVAALVHRPLVGLRLVRRSSVRFSSLSSPRSGPLPGSAVVSCPLCSAVCRRGLGSLSRFSSFKVRSVPAGSAPVPPADGSVLHLLVPHLPPAPCFYAPDLSAPGPVRFVPGPVPFVSDMGWSVVVPVLLAVICVGLGVPDGPDIQGNTEQKKKVLFEPNLVSHQSQ